MRNEYVVHEVSEAGIVGKVVYDWDGTVGSPREEYDNLCVIYYSSNRYVLGDENVDDPRAVLFDLLREKDERAADILYEAEYERGKNIDKILQARLERYYVIRPVYAYIHGGVTISLGRFSDPWDSAQSGIIVCDLDRIRKEWAGHGDVEDRAFLVETANKIIESEIQTFDDYLTGEVYGWYVETENGETLDSCWGYIGDLEYVKGEMQDTFDRYVKDAEANAVIDPLGMAPLREREGHLNL